MTFSWRFSEIPREETVAHCSKLRNFSKTKVAFHLSGLAGQKELVLASLNGKVQGARVHFLRHNSPNSRALVDRSGRTERLWSMSRAILARTSSENSCVPFKNWLVGPDRLDVWKATLEYEFGRIYTEVTSTGEEGYTDWKRISHTLI